MERYTRRSFERRYLYPLGVGFSQGIHCIAGVGLDHLIIYLKETTNLEGLLGEKSWTGSLF